MTRIMAWGLFERVIVVAVRRYLQWSLIAVMLNHMLFGVSVAADNDAGTATEELTIQTNAHPIVARSGISVMPLHTVVMAGGDVIKSQPIAVVHVGETRYQLPQDSSLKQVLMEWATLNGWHVIWRSQHDIRIPTHTTLPSQDWIGLIRSLLDTLALQGFYLNADFYRGNQTLVVSD